MTASITVYNKIGGAIYFNSNWSFGYVIKKTPRDCTWTDDGVVTHALKGGYLCLGCLHIRIWWEYKL